jgi:DNA end-binding protein Ku
MRSIWKGTISFGLVNIPISLAVATQRSDPKFRTLDRESLQPIRQQMVSPARDGAVVEREETIKGFEVAKDQYLPITDEELDSVAVERRRTIDLVAFVDAEEVDPVYFDRTYYLEPQENAEKPYALLLEAMRSTNKAAVGKVVLSSREHLALIRPSGDSLAIELLFYPEDVRAKDEIEEQVRDAKVQKAEVEMATQLVESLTRPFDPGEFENEHKVAVMELVERKLAGEEVPVAAEAPEPAPVPDLMAALRASIDEAKGEKRTGGRRRAAAAAGDGDGRAASGAGSGAGAKKGSKGGGGRSRTKAASKSG